MSNLIGVVGSSGFGKTTSLFKNEDLEIEGLNPEETVIINVTGKPLPMRGANKHYPPNKAIKEGGNHLISRDPEIISKAINYISESRPEIKNLVIDDTGYVMGLELMDNAKKKSFDKWTDLAVDMMKVINSAREARHDLNMIMIFHEEETNTGKVKIKTAGKMIDNNVLLDGLFTVLLYAEMEVSTTEGARPKYHFRTNSDGNNTCKSPIGMFDEILIPNDMGKVVKIVNNYYNG